MAWYHDNKRLTHIATYKTNKEAQKEMEAAAKYGWMPQGVAGQGGHVSIGKTATKALLTGGLGLLTGPSHTKGHLTITYARTPQWLAKQQGASRIQQPGRLAVQPPSSQQRRMRSPQMPMPRTQTQARSPMRRPVKLLLICSIGCILFFAIIIAALANGNSGASVRPTSTVDTVATQDAQVANRQATKMPISQPAKQPTQHPTPIPTVQATPKPTPKPTQPTPLSITFTTVMAGDIAVHTLPGATLTIQVLYCSGHYATSQSLRGTFQADGNGDYEWFWNVETTCSGQATAYVTASANGHTVSGQANFTT